MVFEVAKARAAVFFDSRVPDLQALLDGLSPGTLAFVLDPVRGGVEQIAEIVAARRWQGLSAVHFVAHGQPGRLHLGAGWLDAASLSGQAPLLERIGAALASDGEVLIFGCEVASGAVGRNFLDSLSEALGGVDVAASTSPVGSAPEGGWELDARTGAMAAQHPFRAEALAAYSGTLGYTTGETQVNATSTDEQQGGVVAVLDDGSYAVAWLDYRDYQATGIAVYIRLFNANGTAKGNADTLVARPGNNPFDYTEVSISALPSSASLPGGGFLLTYTDTNYNNSFKNIHGQVYTAAGVTSGGEFTIATSSGVAGSSNDQKWRPSTTVFDDGSFVVAWQESGSNANDTGEIIAQRFNAAHQPIGGSFQVNTNASLQQTQPDVVSLTNGSYGATNGKFVVVWQSQPSGADGGDIYARIFDSSANGGAEIKIGGTTTGQFQPSVTALAGGGFAVTWTSLNQASGSSLNDVYLRVYDANGTALTGETLVNDTLTGQQGRTNVVGLPDGGFLVTWNENTANDSTGAASDIKAQRFDASGQQVGSEFTVNPTTAGAQSQYEFNGRGSTGRDPVSILQYTQGSSVQTAVVTWSSGPSGVLGDFTPINIQKIHFAMHSAPDGANNSKAVTAGTPYTLTASDFGFQDSRFDGAGDSFAGVVIKTVPAAGQGSLQLDGVAVTANRFITATDITGGKLKFVPAADGTDGSFTFAVRDSGGTETGSVNEDQNANTFNFDNSVPNTAPTATNLSFAETYVEDQVLDLTNIVVTDNDAGASITATLQLSNAAAGSLSTSNGATYNAGTGLWSITGTVATVNAALAAVTFTPAGNFNGNFTVATSITDGIAPFVSGSKSFTGTPVNDAPTFTLSANQTVNEDAGVQTVNGFVTGISAGPSNEAGQTLTFSTSNSNNPLFSVQPTIDANGNLTYTLAADANGTATVTVVLQDNGGTASNGVNSTTKTFTITVDPVNDAPTFTLGAGQTVNEDAGAQTVNNFVTGISAGPSDEAGQTLVLSASNDNNSLFTVQPTIDANGNLTYTLADNANGVALVTVVLQDSGGTLNNGVNSTTKTFTITVNGTPDDPVAVNDTISLLQRDTVSANVITGGITPDSDADGNSLTVTNIANGTSSTSVAAGSPTEIAGRHGTLTINADGSYTYAADVEGRVAVGQDVLDTFTYTIADNSNGFDTATLSVTVTGSGTGNANDNIFLLSLANTSAAGGSGDDSYYVRDSNTTVTETSGGGADSVFAYKTFVLGATQQVERLTASDSGVELTGNELANLFYDFTGSGSALVGGAGNDTYYVRNSSTTITETPGGGTDSVFAYKDFTLGATQQVERLTASAAGVQLTGNELANLFYDFAGSGSALVGGAGNDTYYVRNSSTTITETPGGGTDSVFAYKDFTLGATQQVERLTASAAGVQLTGNELANLFYDFAGSGSSLIGGDGNDTYYVHNTATTITETSGGGTDSVFAYKDFTLGATQQVERLTADAANVELTGNELANLMYDFQGSGSKLTGGGGNDTYVVRNSSTTIIEGESGGTDTVNTFVDFALDAGQSVERLQALVGTGVTLIGNELGNTVIGGIGTDSINGGGGKDSLRGGLGTDTFVFNTALSPANIDTITDFNHNDDTIRLDSSIFTNAMATPLGTLVESDFAAVTNASTYDGDAHVIYETRTGKLFYDADGTDGDAAVQFATLTLKPFLDFSDFTAGDTTS